MTAVMIGPGCTERSKNTSTRPWRQYGIVNLPEFDQLEPLRELPEEPVEPVLVPGVDPEVEPVPDEELP